MNRTKNETAVWLLKEMKAAYQTGIEVCINGDRYTPHQEDQIFSILKNGDFMCDYIGDDRGKIIKMCYDRL